MISLIKISKKNKKHKDFIFDDIDSTDYDKSLADNKSLKPIISDFYSLHPNFKHNDFLGDSAFDAVDSYEFLLRKDKNGNSLFHRAFIPLNSRATTDKPDCPLNDDGIPVCPKDKSLKMISNGTSKGYR